MKRRTLLQALGALFASLIGVFAPLRRRLKILGLPPPRVAPAPQNVGWQHLAPRAISPSDIKTYVPTPLGDGVEIDDPGAFVVCAMLRPARSDLSVNLANYPVYRDAMRAAGAVVPDAEPRWPEVDEALDPQTHVEDNS